MSAKEIPNIANYADLHLQNIRKLHITVEVVDDSDNVIEAIHGLSTGGNINVSGNSLIRRTGTLSFVLFDMLLPKKENLLWMTNKIRVYAGIENMASVDNEITHFCLGTFFITEPAIDISKDSRTISINLEDNMMRWEQEQLENKLKIEAGVPLHTAVVQTMNFYGEFKVDVEFTDLKVPYTLEFMEGESILNVLTKLRDLYMDWECFYDIDGTLIFRKMEIQKKDGEPIVWSFDKESDLVTIFKENFTYKEVKNRVVVIGQMDTGTGLTPRAEANITLETSPFHKDQIGQRTMVITDSSMGNAIQCESKAKYELFKRSTFQEKLSINTIPIYYLDANNVIEVRNHATGDLELYVVDSIGIGLGIEDEMSLNCHKLYFNHFEIGGSLGDYQKSADVVINGIQNLGWLSIPEKRIKDYFGLEGDGSKLIVRFEYEGLHGTTAYVTGYYGESTQTLTVDLADFVNPTGDSGDNGNGKAEYADRVLGHEMLHVVMNNSFGVEKTSIIPSWFKEGVGEFIHGADERLKLLIVENGSISNTKLTELVTRATELLNGGSWVSESKDYGASYVILKYLDTKITTGKTMKNLMSSIKQSTKSGGIALEESIVANTGFATFADFVTNFSANAVNHVKLNVKLNIGSDELDTGSIGGSDHRGSSSLNAEKVFDNSLATKGLSANGFVVEFIRP